MVVLIKNYWCCYYCYHRSHSFAGLGSTRMEGIHNRSCIDSFHLESTRQYYPAENSAAADSPIERGDTCMRCLHPKKRTVLRNVRPIVGVPLVPASLIPSAIPVSAASAIAVVIAVGSTFVALIAAILVKLVFSMFLGEIVIG